MPQASSFRVKGNLYRGVLETCDKTVPGGRAAIFEGMEPASRAYMSGTPFLAANWYDLEPFMALAASGARLCNDTVEGFCARVAQHQVDRDLNGVYKLLLKLASPAMIMERFPRTAAQYFDFVSATSTKVSDTTYRYVVSGVPARMLRYYAAVSDVFVRYALERAGARELKILHQPLEADGTKDNEAIVRFSREISWR